ncbi:MAG: translation elongation factor Ts, partial [Nitrospinaceae bacterium]
CKKALNENDANIESSVDWLRSQGLAAAAKKSGRAASEGLVGVMTSGSKGAIIELNSETDFVARNGAFQEFAENICKTALDGDGDVETLKKDDYVDGGSIDEQLTHKIATIGENMNLRRSSILEVQDGVVVSYMHNAIKVGLDVDEFAPRLSFFFNSHLDFFEEIAKYRAARRIWAQVMKEKYGAKSERTLKLRFHTQTAGFSLTAQQPQNNISRTAFQGLAAVLGGTQSLHTNSMDETLALPYDSGSVPITKDELLKCCTGREWSPDLHARSDAGTTGTAINVMGIDYGPVNSDRSYTCISIVRVSDHEQFEVMWAKRYVGKEAEFSFIHKEIPKLMDKWKCSHLCADYAMGEASNSVLREKLGVQKVIAFQHLPSQKEMIRWNSKMPAYTLNRTQVMSNIFEKFRRQKITLPKPHHLLDDLLQDILNIQIF